MHFAWKDENYLIKILTFIMIFIVIIMVAISPVFAFDLSDYDVVFPDEVENSPYYFISSFYLKCGSRYWYSNELYCSNSPFIFEYRNEAVTSTGYHYSTRYYVSSSSSFSYYTLPSGDSGSIPDVSYDYSSASKHVINTGDKSRLNVPLEEYSPDIEVLSTLFYTNSPIVNTEGEEIFTPPVEFHNPSFITTGDELCSGKFDLLKIDMGDLNTYDDKVVFNIYDNYSMGDGVYANYPNKAFMLDMNSEYLYIANLSVYYHIPRDKLGIDISNGKRYTFELASYDGQTVYDSVTFEIGGLTLEEEKENQLDETNQKLDEQTDAIKENTETNKGIWETIKDILSYINPFSENFFVYKLIELLVDAIKSLFIPSDDFFSTYFTELKDWFSDRLGFLFYPFDLIIDILNKILGINFNEPIFNIPDINEPFTNKKIISATTFNFNNLLENNTLNTVHSIYLVLVDAFIVFCLVNLFLRKYKEVTTE